jgi:hypothetical protein
MKIIFTLLTLLFTLSHCFSQDVITKKTSEDIQAKVLEVTTTEIKYKKSDNPEGPTFTIPKSDVLVISYQNGTKDYFDEKIKNENVTTKFSSTGDSFVQGQMDASRYYTGYKGAGTLTLISGLIIPLAGLVPAIICSSTPPQLKNLNTNKPELMKNSDYFLGYTQQAKKIKQRKVWTNWGISFGVNVVAILLLTQQ